MEEKPKETEVVETKDTPMVLEDNKTMLSEKYVETAGKQIELRSKLIMTALKALKPHDFQDFDGKPYLEGEGAARIMAVVRGFKVGEAKFVIEQIAPHYFVDCSIPMEFIGATTVAIGDCSTSDSFFTGRDGKGGRLKRYVEQTGSEVMATRLLLGDAKKKARENAISRGVSELLGLKGLSWSDLEQLGFSRSGAGSSVQFKKGSQGAVEMATIEQGKALKVGSIFHCEGYLTDVKTRELSGGKKMKDYTIQDADGHEIKISSWEIKECVIGNQMYFGNVEVQEYQGRRGYLAKTVEVKEVQDGNGESTD